MSRICFYLLISTSESSVFEGGSEGEYDFYTVDFSSTHSFATLDMMLRHHAHENLSIGIAPYLNKALNVIDAEKIKRAETNFGVRFAVFYKMRG